MPPLPLAQRLQPLEEFFSDPSLTVACVLLIVVSLAWIIVARSIGRRLRRADRQVEARQGNYQETRDIWTDPPP